MFDQVVLDDSDVIYAPVGKDSRGWAMRRGHCKRLRADSGRECARGRASFARSVGMRRQEYFDFSSDNLRDRSMVRLHQAREEIEFWTSAIQERVHNSHWYDAHREWFEEEEEVVDAPTATSWSLCQENSSQLSPDPDSTCASSSEDDIEDDGLSSSTFSSSICALDVSLVTASPAPKAKKGCFWTLVLKRAEVNAKEYFHNEKIRKQREEEERLAKEANKPSPPLPPPPKEPTPFEKLCDSFLERHQDGLTQDLGKVLQSPIRFEKIAMGDYPVNSFMKKRPKYNLLEPLIHGTKMSNYPSIFRQGLVIPTPGSGVRVANGSAHGVGIYTTRPFSAATSRGYSDVSRLLVCALARHEQDDTSIKRPNSGVAVIFEEARVIPMFQAIGADAVDLSAPPPPPPPLPRPSKKPALVYRPGTLKPRTKLGLEIRRERRRVRKLKAQSARQEQQLELLSQFGSLSLVRIVSFLDRSAARRRR